MHPSTHIYVYIMKYMYIVYVYIMCIYIWFVNNSCTSIYYLEFLKHMIFAETSHPFLSPSSSGARYHLVEMYSSGCAVFFFWVGKLTVLEAFNKKSNLYMYINIEISTGKKWKQHLIPEKHMWIQHHSEDVPAISSWFSGKITIGDQPASCW